MIDRINGIIAFNFRHECVGEGKVIMKLPNRLHGVLTSRWWIPAVMAGGMWIVGCDHDHHDEDRGRPAAYHEEGVYRDNGYHNNNGYGEHHEEHHDRD
ncbi:MAG: hypothetical protein JWP03_664 [Phycisphaerales bacterium]|nr:hypothetical protein [Phycisphaerales bacterium]